MSCCQSCAQGGGSCPGGPMVLQNALPYFTGFPKYPYVTHSPSPFGFSRQTKRAAHMVAETAGLAAAPVLWWASNQTQDPRARAALRAIAVGQGLVDAGFLAWNAWEMYQERRA